MRRNDYLTGGPKYPLWVGQMIPTLRFAKGGAPQNLRQCVAEVTLAGMGECIATGGSVLAYCTMREMRRLDGSNGFFGTRSAGRHNRGLATPGSDGCPSPASCGGRSWRGRRKLPVAVVPSCVGFGICVALDGEIVRDVAKFCGHHGEDFAPAPLSSGSRSQKSCLPSSPAIRFAGPPASP